MAIRHYFLNMWTFVWCAHLPIDQYPFHLAPNNCFFIIEDVRMFKNWKYCLYWKCMHTVGEPVAQTLFCRTGFLLTTRSLYIALTQQNLLLVSNGCLPIHLQVGYSWSSPKRPTLRLLIRNRHLIWRRVKEIKAVLVLLLSDLRVVWRSEIYTLMALLSSFWFHKCSS